jgi:hypothetical protein
MPFASAHVACGGSKRLASGQQENGLRAFGQSNGGLLAPPPPRERGPCMVIDGKVYR